jgi:Chitobiase/beta-hexosaminidase C-terminal domain
MTAADEFAPFKPCEYLRWGAGYSSNGTQPANTWFGTQPDYTTQTFLPQRRNFFTQELQKHPLPAGAQPGPNPQPLYLSLEPPTLTVVAPGDPLPPGWSAVKLDARLQGAGGTNPPGTVIRYTIDGSDPSTVEFPPFSLNPSNTGGVYFGGQPDWINVPNGTVIRARATVVDFYSIPPPPGGETVVAERIVADSLTTATLTP